ncbi:MAG: hypothetical protein KJ645_13820, partial [Planctomycetes bacterium]|nr:hypothetical protein [Planctomycetota bacterium]
GAAAGALCATLWWLPAWGLSTSLYLFPLINTFAGLGALGLAALYKPDPAPLTSDSPDRPSFPETPVPRQAGWWILAFASGFLILAMETAYARLFALHLSQSVYGFGLMVAGFVAGLGFGAVAANGIVTRFPRLKSILGGALLAAGVVVALSVWALEKVGLFAAQMILSLGGDASTEALFTVKFFSGFVVLLPPTFLLGLIFPLILARLSDNPLRRAASVGAVYGLNTVGSVAGALLGALLIVPSLGPQGAIQTGALICAVTGAVMIAFTGKPLSLQGKIAVSISVLFAGLAVLVERGMDQGYLLRSPAIYARSQEMIDWYKTSGSWSGKSELLFKRSDNVATVAVGRQIDQATGYPQTFFSINGKIEGSNLVVDMMNQVRIADWPFAFAGPIKEDDAVLVIGLGTGVTVGQTLRYPVGRVDACELSAGVIEVAKNYFAAENNRALEHPKLNLVLADGRRFAAAADERYRIIISEPSNPWVAGMGSLFTRDCYGILKNRLKPGGVLGQWIHTYDLGAELFRSLVATFQAVFPTCYLASNYPYGWDLVLIGLNEEQGFSKPRLEIMVEALKNRVPSNMLDPFSLSSVDDLCFGLLAGPEALKDYIEGAPPATDDNGLLELEAPKKFLGERKERQPGLLRDLFSCFEPADRTVAYDATLHPDFIERARALQIDAMVWMRLQRSLDGILSLNQPILREEVEALNAVARLVLSKQE